MMKEMCWLGALAGLFLCGGFAFGQASAPRDSDSDGILDCVERRLGTDPSTAEKLEVVWENPKPAAADASRDIRKILLGNVAGNRYLWVVEFAADFDLKNTNLTVYVEADNDGDGIPDAPGEQLATDPKAAERLEVVWDAAKAPAAARRNQARARSPGRSIRRVWFGNVGGDRFLWRIEFDADYPTANSTFILYLDTDNDPKTGRTDMPGVDYMLSVSNGGASIAAISPAGQYTSGPPLRMFLRGKRLYLCADLPLHQEGGRSVYRATALSEQRKPAWGESTGWFPRIL